MPCCQPFSTALPLLLTVALLLPATVPALVAADGIHGSNGGSSDAPDSGFACLFQFDSYCAGQPSCAQAADGSVVLTLAGTQGGGFTSRDFFQYGVFEVSMRLPAGFSGGVIPCFYLTGPGNPDYHSVHDEIDFEFIGGATPQDIVMHTNLISGGQAFLEQFSFPPSVDPSASFHNFSIRWSPSSVAWFFDGAPIRITRRQPGLPFPTQHLGMQASIWAPPWTSLQYSGQPTSVAFRRFHINACRGPLGAGELPCARRPGQPWTTGFSGEQRRQLREFRQSNLLHSFPWSPV